SGLDRRSGTRQIPRRRTRRTTRRRGALMTALDDRAEIIADWWRDHPGEHTWGETLRCVHMCDSGKSKCARKRACEIAVMRGDQIQYAVYANHNTWRYVQGSTDRQLGDPVTP